MKTGFKYIIPIWGILLFSLSYSQVVYKEYPLTVNTAAGPNLIPFPATSLQSVIDIDLDEDGTKEFSLDAGTGAAGDNTASGVHPSTTSTLFFSSTAPVAVPAAFTQCLNNNALSSFGVAYHFAYVYSINYTYSGASHSFTSSNLDFAGTATTPNSPLKHSDVTSYTVPYLVNSSSFGPANIKGFVCLGYNAMAKIESGSVCANDLSTGNFPPMANNYYPFRIKMKDNLYHYGWLQLAGSGSSRTLRIAYEATAGAPVITGQTVPLTHCSTLANITSNPSAPAICQTLSGSKYNLVLAAPQSSNYAYQWRKDGSLIAGATSHTHSTILAGSYDVIVTDIANMCKDTSASVNAFVSPVPSINAGRDTSICEGTSVRYEPVATGNGPFTYLWESVAGLTISNPSEANQDLTPTQFSWVRLNVYDVYGCRNHDTVVINIIPTSPITLNASGTICPPSPANQVVFSFNNTVSYVYKDNTPYTVSAAEIAAGSLQTTIPGEYYVVRNNSCGSVQSNKINIPACMDYATISGTVFNDLNNDGVKDVGENGVPDVVIKASEEDYAISNAEGEYKLYVSSGQTYEVEMIKPFDFYLQTLPAGSHQIVIPATGIHEFSGKDFGLYQPPFKDLQVNISSAVIRSGFSTVYFIHCKNLGTEVLNATVDFTYNTQLTFNNALPLQSSHNAGSQLLTFDLASLAPGESRIIKISFTASVSLPLGSEVIATAEGVVSEADTDLSNNMNTLRQIVVGSYDPNDKVVSPEGQGDERYVKSTDKLTYTIRFQNTGTYYAYNVIVKDTIDESLDLSSFKSLAVSHNCDITLDSNRVITWAFNGIMLPDSNRDESGSHGFIRFALKQKAISENTVIKNKAYIYFDFNEPIITNEVSNKVNDNMVLANKMQPAINAFDLYPNPAGNYITITTGVKETNYCIMDLKGRIIQEGRINDEKADISDLESGLYLIKVETKDAVSYQRFLKQ